MRKKRSLIVSLTLALLLVLSAPFALVFNKDKTTKAEMLVTSRIGLSSVVTTANASAGKVAIATSSATPARLKGGVLQTYPTENAGTVTQSTTSNVDFSGKGILVPFYKDVKATTMSFDITDNTKDDVLIDFLPYFNYGLRVYFVKIVDESGNWVGVQIHNGWNYTADMGNGWFDSDARLPYTDDSLNGKVSQMYTKASGQTYWGGINPSDDTDFVSTTFVSGTAVTDSGVTVPSLAAGVAVDAVSAPVFDAMQRLYWDNEDKALYADVAVANASSNLGYVLKEKVLIRDFDATENEGFANGGDTAFAGFDSPVHIEFTHVSGGANTNYGVYVQTLDGATLEFDSLENLSCGYTVSDAGVFNGTSTYAFGGEEECFSGDEKNVPAVVKLKNGGTESAEGWTKTLVNTKGNFAVDTTFECFDGTNYLVFTKAGEGRTHVVSYLYRAKSVGFENEYANIFDAGDPAVDGYGKARVSLPVDMETGASTLPTRSSAFNFGGVLATFPKVNARTTDSYGVDAYLHGATLTVPSVKISDNASTTPLITTVPLRSDSATVNDGVRQWAVTVYETANPNNYFTVFIGCISADAAPVASDASVHTSAMAVGQKAFGARTTSNTSAQANLYLSSVNKAFGTEEITVSYDNSAKTVYVNGFLVRDFDATDWHNGLNCAYTPTANDPVWGGFTTDEVSVVLSTMAGAGDMLITNVDGNDLSFEPVDNGADGYTLARKNAYNVDYYSATKFVGIGSNVLGNLPMPSVKTLASDFEPIANVDDVATIKVDGVVVDASSVWTAGKHTVTYYDESSNLLATAYVVAYDDSLEEDFAMFMGTDINVLGMQWMEEENILPATGTVRQGAPAPLMGTRNGTTGRTNSSTFVQSGTTAKTVKDGLMITADYVDEKPATTVAITKSVYVGDNTADEPLVSFAMTPEYVRYEAYRYDVILADANDYSKQVILCFTSPSNTNGADICYGSSVTGSASYLEVYAPNGADGAMRTVQLRHNGDGYTGGIHAVSANLGGWQNEEISLYYDREGNYLKIAPKYATNDIVAYFSPDEGTRTANNIPADYVNWEGFSGEIMVMFRFLKWTDDQREYDPQGDNGAKNNYSKASASGIADSVTFTLTNLDGQSFAQTNGEYTKKTGLALSNAFSDATSLTGAPEKTAEFFIGCMREWDDGTEGFVAGDISVYKYDMFGEYGVAAITKEEFETAGGTITVYDPNLNVIPKDANDPSVVWAIGDTLTVTQPGNYKVMFQTGSNAVTAIYAVSKNYTIAQASNVGIYIKDEYEQDPVNAHNNAEYGGQRMVFDNQWDTDELVIVPASGYAITSIMVAGEEKLTAPVFGNYNLEVTYDGIDDGDSLEVTTTAIYTVNFQPNNGATIDSVSVINGNKVSAPTEPVKAHYDFAGWYKEETLTNAWNFTADTVSESITLYAKWTPTVYTITYDLAGGTVTHTNPTSYTVEDADITLVAPTSAEKTGYTFAGWSVATIETSTGGAVTVTATWTANTYDVTFEENGGSAVTDTTADYNTLVTKPTDPTKEGYTFAGWYKEEALENAWVFETDKVTGDVTLYAKWTINVYEVTFTDGVATQEVNHGAKATEPTAPTKTGYTFGGWFVGETAYDFNSAVTGNVALTAKWTINTYNVTFEVNGGSAVTATTANYDTLVTKPADPTKEGYTFAGWYKEEALTTAWNFETDKVTADVKLYAKWTEVVEEPTPDTTPDAPKEEKKGCGKEAVGLLAIVLSALAVVFVSKRK